MQTTTTNKSAWSITNRLSAASYVSGVLDQWFNSSNKVDKLLTDNSRKEVHNMLAKQVKESGFNFEWTDRETQYLYNHYKLRAINNDRHRSEKQILKLVKQRGRFNNLSVRKEDDYYVRGIECYHGYKCTEKANWILKDVQHNETINCCYKHTLEYLQRL